MQSRCLARAPVLFHVKQPPNVVTLRDLKSPPAWHNRHYAGDPDADVNAIRDINNYLSEKQWNIIIEAAFDREHNDPTFIRVFRPDQYQTWYDGLPD